MIGADVRDGGGDRGVVRATVRDADSGEVRRHVETRNVITVPIHEHWAAYLNPDASAPARPTITHIALGDDATAEDALDRSLSNEVYRMEIAEYEADGRDTLTTSFLGQTEANGETIREVGLVTGGVNDDWILVNHATFSSTDEIAKDATITVTFDVTLQWRPA